MRMRTLITRENPEPLAGQLSGLGLDSIHVPLVMLEATGLKPPPGVPEWALVTSAAVTRFAPQLDQILGNSKVVAVGNQTADALEGVGIKVAKVGEAGGIEALGLVGLVVDELCWYVGAEHPSVGLKEAMERRGVLHWPVYRNCVPKDAVERLHSATYDCVTFASGSAVRAFVGSVGVPRVPVVVLGPSTKQAAESLGVRVAGMAAEPTMQSLAAAVNQLQ